MGISRRRVPAARRLYSRRSVWFCLSDNEPKESKEICWKKILLESKDIADNENEEKKKKTES